MRGAAYAAPPDQSVWWDATATRDAVLHLLRLTDTDVDVAQIEALIPAAGQMINNELDRVDPLVAPPPPPLQVELERVVIRLYRAKDVQPLAADVGPYWSPTATDPLYESRAALRPYRQRWGIG